MDVPQDEGGQDGTGPICQDGNRGDEVGNVGDDAGVGAGAFALIPSGGHRMAPSQHGNVGGQCGNHTEEHDHVKGPFNGLVGCNAQHGDADGPFDWDGAGDVKELEEHEPLGGVSRFVRSVCRGLEQPCVLLYQRKELTSPHAHRRHCMRLKWSLDRPKCRISKTL